MLSSSSIFSTSLLSSAALAVSPNPPPAPSRTRFRPLRAAATATSFASEQEKRPRGNIGGYLNPKGMASCTSLYEVLGIPVGASNQEIKTAYRRLARVCHPDVAATGRKDSSADEFMKIHAAYSTLSDPEKRAVYDSKLMWRHQRPLTSVSRFNGYRSRNWETDQCW